MFFSQDVWFNEPEVGYKESSVVEPIEFVASCIGDVADVRRWW